MNIKIDSELLWTFMQLLRIFLFYFEKFANVQIPDLNLIVSSEKLVNIKIESVTTN